MTEDEYCLESFGFTKLEFVQIARKCVRDLTAIADTTDNEKIRISALRDLTSISFGQLNKLSNDMMQLEEIEDEDGEEDWR